MVKVLGDKQESYSQSVVQVRCEVDHKMITDHKVSSHLARHDFFATDLLTFVPANSSTNPTYPAY